MCITAVTLLSADIISHLDAQVCNQLALDHLAPVDSILTTVLPVSRLFLIPEGLDNTIIHHGNLMHSRFTSLADDCLYSNTV